MNKLKNTPQLFIMRGTALVCSIPLFHKGADLLSVDVYNDGAINDIYRIAASEANAI